LNCRDRLLIDVDSTVVSVYGNQEGTCKGYNPHKRGLKSYHPLLVFNSSTKEVLQGYLRSGDAYTSNNIIGFMSELLSLYPDNSFFFRADCGFFDGKLFSFFEKRGISYLVKAKNISSILEHQYWKPLSEEEKQETGFSEYCDFKYACEGWEKPRRFVALRKLVLRKINNKHNKVKKTNVSNNQPLLFDESELECPRGKNNNTETNNEENIWVYEYVCYVTTENSPVVEVHKLYKQRGTCETYIDETKNQMSLGRIRTNNFKANECFFYCSILAYNIIRYMTALSKDKTLIRLEIQTIRTFLIRVAGKLSFSSNQYKLSYSKGLLYKKQWVLWCRYT